MGALRLSRSLLPAAASHPIVHELLGRRALVSIVEFDAGARDGISDSVRFVRRGNFCIEEREQRWFVQGHGSNASRAGEGRNECNRGTVGMTHQCQRRACSGENRFDQRDLVAQANDLG